MAADNSNDSGPILVPLDGSSLAEQAIPYAAAIARDNGRLIYLQVTLDPEPVRGLLGNVTASREEVAATYREAAQGELEQAAERWQEIAEEFEIVVVPGDPAEEILRLAEERQCEMIVLATHGRGAVERWTFGSVADRIARTATVPVLLVRPRGAQAEVKRPTLRRLVVPYDGSELSAEALPVAQRLAARLDLPVHLVQVINPAAALMPYPSMEATFPTELLTELEREMDQGAQSSLDEAARPLTDAGVAVSTAVERGDAAGAIDAATTDGDLVVMTSHGRGGVRRWLLGSVAEKLVRNGKAPVLLVPASTRVQRV